MQEIMAQSGECQILCVTHNLAFQQICSSVVQVLEFILSLNLAQKCYFASFLPILLACPDHVYFMVSSQHHIQLGRLRVSVRCTLHARNFMTAWCWSIWGLLELDGWPCTYGAGCKGQALRHSRASFSRWFIEHSGLGNHRLGRASNICFVAVKQIFFNQNRRSAL